MHGMHGVERVRLVVVSPLVVAHVNRDGCVEGGEDVVGGCRSTESTETELVNERGSGEETSKKTNNTELDFQKETGNFKGKLGVAAGGYNKSNGNLGASRALWCNILARSHGRSGISK